MAHARDKHWRGKDVDDFDDDDGRVWFFLPSEDIDFEVLASDLRCYLGNGARVEIESHPITGRPGYYIKSAVPVTAAMIEDLKADSQRWRAERRKSNVRHYDDSDTHRIRKMNGPSQRPPLAASYRQSREREGQDRPLQGAREQQTILERWQEREEDPYRYPSTMSLSSESNIPPRTSSQYPSSDPSRTKEAAYEYQSTAMTSRGSYGYPAPSRGFEHASWHGRDSAANIPAGGVSVNYRQTETTVEVSESAYERAAPGNQYSSQPRFTQRQIEEVEMEITRALESRGHTVVGRQEFDRLVNERLKTLYGFQQQQYQPKPLSSNQGGQNPPPLPVPLTQFAGSGSQNLPPGSLPFNQLPGSGKPPEPPEATQPDYSGSYGFTGKYATSGGPESSYPKESNESFFTEHSNQPYDPPSAKYQPRKWS